MVATNGNLGGTGTINGPVTVLAQGSVEGGASTIGTLNLASLTLAGALWRQGLTAAALLPMN